MLVVKQTRIEKSKTNLKKSLVFGGTMASLAMGLGLSVSIPLYYHIQEQLKEAIDQAFDMSKWLLELARMLGIEPGENFEAELSNGYSLVVDKLNDDNSGTIILKKNGSLSTIIINIDKYGNMTSAGEVSGPGAQEIIDIINSAQDIIGEESNAIDGILESINKEVDYTSLRIEYASRKSYIETIIDDNLEELKNNHTPAGMSEYDWYDLAMVAHLASKFKVQETAMTSTKPAVWSIDLASSDGDKESAIERGVVVADPINDVENIEHLYGFIDTERESGLSFIAKIIADQDAYNTWVMTHGSEADRDSAIADAGSAINDAADDIKAEQDAAADREDDMIAGADEAKNEAINDAAANNPGILDQLLVNPQTWIAAYIQTFGYTDLVDDSNSNPETVTLRNTMKARLIQNHMSEGKFDALDEEIQKLIQKDSNGNVISKTRVSQLANTYSHEDAITAVLYSLRFETTSQIESSPTNEITTSKVLVAHSSINSINEFDQQQFYSETEEEHDIILQLSEVYLSGYSDYITRQSIINMKRFAFSTGYEDIKAIKDDANGTYFEQFALGYSWATRQRGDDNVLKQTLAFEMLDAIADRFFFEGRAIIFDQELFGQTLEELDALRKAENPIISDSVAGIYETTEVYTQKEWDLLAAFEDSTNVNYKDLTAASLDFLTTTDTDMLVLRDNGYSFKSFTTASDPLEYLISLKELVTLPDFALITTEGNWPSADQILNNYEASQSTRRQGLESLIFFASENSNIEITDPDSLDKIEVGAGVGGSLEDNTGLNPDEIEEVTDGINEVIADDSLTIEELKEVVKYTTTVFIVIPDEAEAHAKLKVVLDPATITQTIPGEIYSGIEKITLLNEWVDDLTAQGVAITPDSIENYVWHKDQVEVLSAGQVTYKLADGNLNTVDRGNITSAQYSPSLDIVIAGEGFVGGGAYSVPYILEKGASETVIRTISGAEDQVLSSSIFSSPAWNEDLQTLALNKNTGSANGLRLVKMDSATTGTSQTWTTTSAPTGGTDQDNNNFFFRNGTLSNDGHMYGITHSGAIFKSSHRLINPDTKVFENIGATISWTSYYIHDVNQGLRGVFAPTLAQWGGEDYVILPDVQSTTNNQDYGVGNVDGQMTIVSLTTGTAWKYLNFPTSFVGLSVDNAGRMIYGLTGTGQIWRIDMENLDDMSAHKQIIDLFELSSSTGIDVADLTANFITDADAATFNAAYPAQVTTKEYMGKSTGVRGLFYNPSTTEITIYGTDSDIYIPNKSIALIQIFDYLVN